MWVSKETTSGPRKKTFEFLVTSFGLRFGFMASSSSSRALVEFLIFQGTQVRPRISTPLERPQSTGWNEVQLVDSLVLLMLSSSLTLALTWFYCVHFDREKHPAMSGIMMVFVNTTDT